MARRTAVDVPGLGKLRRDLRAIDKGLGKQLTDHIRGIVRPIRDTARRKLRERSKNPRNRIEKTVKHSVRAKGASIYTDHPGGAVQNWGGTIEPKGSPIEIEGKRYLDGAVYEHTKDVEDELGRTVDVLARFNGFKH